MTSKSAVRRAVVTVLGSVVAVAALFALDQVTKPDGYETHVDVVVNPVDQRALYDDAVAAQPPRAALAHEIRFINSDEVQALIASGLPFEHHIEVTPVGDDRIRFETSATTAEEAVGAAASAGAAYGQLRMAAGHAEVQAVIGRLEARVQELSATAADPTDPGAAAANEELATTQQELDRATAALVRIDEGTAGFAAPPETPCCPRATHPGRAALVGGLVGLALGLVLVAIMTLEERVRGRSTQRVAPRAESSDRPTWVGPAVVALVVVGRSAIYAVQGARFLLDDFSHLYYRSTEGVLATSPHFRLLNRPGAWLTQTVLFNLSGERPLALFLLLSLLNIAAALALYFAIARFFPRPIPVLVAGLWVLTANHSALTVWGAAAPGVVSLALCFGGVMLMSKGRWVGALVLLSTSLLCYELTIALCFATAILVGTPLARPLDRESVVRPVRPWQRLVMVVVLIVVVLWMSRDPVYPLETHAFNAWDTLAGHVSWGLVSTTAAPTLLLRALEVAAVAGLVACVVAWLRGDRDRGTGPVLAVTGAVVMALGLFLVAAVPGGLGLYSRLYGASSVGTAMIMVGSIQFLWFRLRTVAVVTASALVILCVVGQAVALRSAHRAGEDVVALMHFIDKRVAAPEDTNFFVETRPEHNGFIGVDHLSGAFPYKLAYPDSSGSMRLAVNPGDLVNAEPGWVTVTWAEVLDQ